MIGIDPEVRRHLPRWVSHPRNLAEPMPHKLIDAGVAWIEANLDRVDPARQAGAHAAGTPVESPLIELTVVLRWLYHRRLSPESGQAVSRCLDRLAEIVQREPIRDKLFRQTPALQYYIWLLVMLRDCGRLADESVEWPMLQRLVDLDHGCLHSPAHPAHGRMELRYILDLGGLRHHLPSFAELWPHNVLGAPIDPITITDFEAYAVTHIVMYASDMGLNPVTGLSPEHRLQAEQAVQTLLSHYLCAGHLDLVAELLLCRHALRMPSNDLADLAWRCLAGAQLPEGAVPGPYFDPAVAASLPEAKHGIYLFRSSYHTTLVTMMAMSLLAEGHHEDA